MHTHGQQTHDSMVPPNDPPDEGDDLDAADPVECYDDPFDDLPDEAVDFLYDPPSLNR